MKKKIIKKVKKAKMNRKPKEKGITLIALVVTMIILLILAGGTLNLGLGENGLITKAQQASNLMAEATAEEQQAMELMASMASKAWTGEVATGFANETEENVGTTENPYQITNAAELAHFVEEVNSGNKFTGQTIEIVNNINMGGKPIEPAGKGTLGGNVSYFNWIDVPNYFEGTLDGKNNTIANLNINQENMNGVGLIGVLGENGEVKNIKIYNGNLVGKTKVGAVVGESKGIITNCHNIDTKVTAQDNPSINNSGSAVGGIIGFAVKGTITNCSNSGEVLAKNYNGASSLRGHASGGIIGVANSALGEIEIKDCTNTGTIKCEYQKAGGILGYSNTTSANATRIKNCSNNGKIESLNVGGIRSLCRRNNWL